MHFPRKRWRLALMAVLAALAMSVAFAGHALAAEPGEAGWWAPESVGNQTLAAQGTISEARNGGNLLDVWRGATNNQVWLSWNNGDPFSLFNPDGSPTATYVSPTVVAFGPSAFLVFHTGTDARIYYTVVSPSGGGWTWSGRWLSVPYQYTNMAVSVTPLGPGSANLYMVYHSASDDRVWGTAFVNGQGWGQTTNIAGGYSPSAPSVTFNPYNNHLFVAARGEDNQVWMTNDIGGNWNSWQATGGGPTYVTPQIAALPDGNMLLAEVDNNTLYPNYRTYDSQGRPTGYWSPDITTWQTNFAVALSVAVSTVYVIMTGLDGRAWWKPAYQG